MCMTTAEGSLEDNSHTVLPKLQSWTKVLMLLRTRQMQTLLHLPNLAPHPPYNVENYYLQFLLIFNIVLGREGEQ